MKTVILFCLLLTACATEPPKQIVVHEGMTYTTLQLDQTKNSLALFQAATICVNEGFVEYQTAKWPPRIDQIFDKETIFHDCVKIIHAANKEKNINHFSLDTPSEARKVINFIKGVANKLDATN